jgi:hypothetical protein
MGENFNPDELVCGGCSDIAKAQVRIISQNLLFILMTFFDIF